MHICMYVISRILCVSRSNPLKRTGMMQDLRSVASFADEYSTPGISFYSTDECEALE